MPKCVWTKMEDKEGYHCGPWWLPRWIRRVLSVRFNASCKIHDLDYEASRFDREEADTRFLLHMIRQSRHSLGWEIMATVFYLAVRVVGKTSWGRRSDGKT